MCFVGAHYFWGLHPCDSYTHNLTCKQNKYKYKYKCSAYENTYTTKEIEKEKEEDGERKRKKPQNTQNREQMHLSSYTYNINSMHLKHTHTQPHIVMCKFKRLAQKYSLCCNTNVTTTWLCHFRCVIFYSILFFRQRKMQYKAV